MKSLRKIILVISFFMMVLSLYAEIEVVPVGNLTRFNIVGNIIIKDKEIEPLKVLSADIDLINYESYPVNDLYLTVQVVKGPLTDLYGAEEAVIYEKTYAPITILPWETKTINFNYEIPVDALEGDYYIYIYLDHKLTSQSLPNFKYLKFASFKVKNSKGSYPEIYIDTNKSYVISAKNIKCYGINPCIVNKDTINTTTMLYVKNRSSEKIENMQALVYLCRYEDISCSNPIYVQNVFLEPIPANTESQTPFSINVPSEAGPYSLKVELTKNQRIFSIHRFRIIVSGEKVLLKKFFLDKTKYSANDTAKLTAMIEVNPEDYNRTISLDGYSLELEVKKIKDEILFSKKINLDEISSTKFNSLVVIKEQFDINKEIDYFIICARLKKNDVGYLDFYCYDVNSNITKKEEYNIVKVTWDYDRFGKLLYLTFYYDNKDLPLDIYYEISNSKYGKISLGRVNNNNNELIPIRVEPDIYRLDYVDNINNKVYVEEIDIREEILKKKSCSELGGNLCLINETCDGNMITSLESKLCCIGKCSISNYAVGALVSVSQQTQSLSLIFLYVVLAFVILLLIFGIYVRSLALGRRKRKKSKGDGKKV